MQPPEAATETPSASKDVNKPHRDSRFVLSKPTFVTTPINVKCYSGIISFSVKPTWHANGLTIRCNPRLQTFAKLKASLGEKKNMKAPPPSSWLLCYVVGAGDPPVSYWFVCGFFCCDKVCIDPEEATCLTMQENTLIMWL
jgi:hypothetical protein